MAEKRQAIENKQDTLVAIIGMGCFFPNSSGLKDYWRLIFHGEDAIAEVPSTHWSPEDYFDDDAKRPDHTYCKRGGFLAPIMFDPTEFGIPPNTLEATDTSQLLGLVAAKMALKDAGYDNGKPFDRDRTSVILGVTGTQELVIPLSSRLGFPKWRRALEAAGVSEQVTENVMNRISRSYVPWQENSFPGLLGNVVAGRICNRLDLGGTNCVVDAACASSMSAIHLALLELYAGRSDMVVTGGVDTLNDIFMHMCFSKTHILSPTGDARPFSKDADGTVIGEGIGILIFKRLEDAESDGDRIYAVIRGIGSSSDGKSQSIYAPRAEGQAKALRMAYQKAGVEPLTVGLLEAHGTGTRVGDRVEFNALCQVFENENRNGHKCALGSVKSMIGHTKAAAGAAGLIKTALSLHHKILPPTLKVDEPDPKLGIVDSPFYINTRTRPWFTGDGQPRRSGVSSFGFGGSNFHVVLEEYQPEKNRIAWDGSVEIVALSAASKNKLQSKLQQFQRKVDSGKAINGFSAAAAQTRREFSHQDPYRLLVIFDHQQINSGQAADRMRQWPAVIQKDLNNRFENQKGLHYGTGRLPGDIAFLFPGQGSQYPGMGRDLVCCFPEAFTSIATADIAFGRTKRLSEYIYPLPPKSAEEEQIQAEKLRSTEIAQPAIGAVSRAMLKILANFGITPNATGGHSFGELTALHAAGWLDKNAFFKLAVSRGRLMAASGSRGGTNSGGMLAVKAPLEDIANLIKKHRLDIVLANKNSPEQGVVSGSQAAIAAAEKCFHEQNLTSIRLPVSAAFHSPLVQDARAPFTDVLKQIRFTPAQIPVFSNTTAEPYAADTDRAVEMLADHLLYPVDFVGEIENLYRSGVRTFIEVGPKSILSGLVTSILRDKKIHAIAVDSSGGKRFGILDLADALCSLAALGYPVALDKWESTRHGDQQPKMQIPISGANYTGNLQQKIPAKDSANGSSRQPHQKNIPNTKTLHPAPNPVTTDPVRSHGNLKEMKKKNQNQPQQDFIHQALEAVQQGLASMQALQKQTADAHQKFLETQQESSRTLQHMMESTRRLAEVSFGLAPTAQRSEFSTEENNALIPEPLARVPEPSSNTMGNEASSSAPPHGSPSLRMDTGSDDLASSLQPDGKLQIAPAQPPPPITQEKLTSGILEVVSELTGYPQEMIDMDMDIEADLGIDSIKRVEILSTLEEKMPDLPSISPEVMGKMKTLRQISMLFTDAAHGEESMPPEERSQTRPLADSDTAKPKICADECQALETTLLTVVGDLTGYPPEMIEMDMDIEADLGIDSIKRVEILSTLEEKMPELPAVSPEVMGSLKTLRQIVDFLDGTLDADEGGAEPAAGGLEDTATAKSDADMSAAAMCSPVTENLERRQIKVVAKPLDQAQRISLPSGRKVFITDDQTGLSEAIADELATQGINTVLISPDILNYKKHLPPAAGLIIVQNPDSSLHSKDLKQFFGLTHHVAKELIAAAADQNAVFGVVSRLDGGFGFKGKGVADPLQGALAGLVKTAALEWESVRCRAIDVTPEWRDVPAIAKAVVDELLNADPGAPVEIGLNVDDRYVLQLEPAPIPRQEAITDQLRPGDVVVVSGGARGVTAAAACALVSEMPLTLVLLGRSPNPEQIPSWLEDLEDSAAIKKAILKNEFGGQNPSPKALEAAYRAHMTNREISRTLENIRSFGATALYYSIDIRNEQAVDATLESIREKYGPIKGIIHGAGVLEDRLIIDKTEEQFSRVFETKVMGLKILLSATEKDPLQHLVIFSSVTARLGNRGQADYAMANEALNKIAQQIAAQKQQLRVVSINWGPWDGGMVNPSLKREFERNGVALIPVDQGAKHMVREMLCADDQGIEVVVGSGFHHADAVRPAAIVEAAVTLPPEATPRNDLALTFKRSVDLQRFPILRSHVLDGKAVVPLALMAEWFGHGALHQNPGLRLHGLDDMRVLTGIKLDGEARLIRLLASKTLKKGASFEVSLELRDGYQGNIEVVHSRAKAILIDTPIQPPDFKIPETLAVRNYTRPITEVYDKILFHGRDLHGIREISHCSSKGIVARISSAPAPSRWMQEPLRNKWLSDPLVLDSAFQMAIIWCYEEQGAVSLPSYCEAYRQYRDRFPEAGVTAVLEIREANAYKLTGDFTFLDSRSAVVARITGYEAVMDPALYKAFKPQHAA